MTTKKMVNDLKDIIESNMVKTYDKGYQDGLTYAISAVNTSHPFLDRDDKTIDVYDKISKELARSSNG